MRRSIAILLLLCLLLPLLPTMTSCKEKEPSVAPSYLDNFDYSTLSSELLKKKVAEVPQYYATLCSTESINALNAVLAEIQQVTEPIDAIKEARLASRLTQAIKQLEPLKTDVPRISIYSPQDFFTFEERDTYVPASIHVLWNGKTKALLKNDDGARIKLHGNSTLDAVKKSLTVKLSSKEDLFGFGKSKTWFLISNAFDKALMRNTLTYDFAAAAGLSDSVQNQFVEVWYNNVYIGCYLATEKAESGDGRLDINTKTGGDFLIEYEKNRWSEDTTYVKSPTFGLRFAVIEPENPTAAQLADLTDKLKQFEDAILSGDRERISAKCDVASFVNFYITSEIFKTIDFSYSSTKFYCKDGIWHAGPVWDYDLSAGNALVNPETKYRDYNNAVVDGISYGDGSEKSAHGIWCDTLWFGFLLESDWFSAAVKARYRELQPQIVNLYQKNELGESRMDALLTTYGNAFDRNYKVAGWSLDRESVGRYTDGTFSGSVDYLRTWLKDRNEWLSAHWGIS